MRTAAAPRRQCYSGETCCCLQSAFNVPATLLVRGPGLLGHIRPCPALAMIIDERGVHAVWLWTPNRVLRGALGVRGGRVVGAAKPFQSAGQVTQVGPKNHQWSKEHELSRPCDRPTPSPLSSDYYTLNSSAKGSAGPAHELGRPARPCRRGPMIGVNSQLQAPAPHTWGRAHTSGLHQHISYTCVYAMQWWVRAEPHVLSCTGRGSAKTTFLRNIGP